MLNAPAERLGSFLVGKFVFCSDLRTGGVQCQLEAFIPAK